MSSESFQDTLFEDPIGLRFRHAREKARWTQEWVAQQLKLPVALLDAIEREDWQRLGAPIFARSYVGSYAKFLGLPASLADEAVRGKAAPQLATIGGNSPARRSFDRSAMKFAYLLLTVLIIGAVVALAVYFQAPSRSAELLPLDPPSTYASAAPDPAAATADPGVKPPAAALPAPAPPAAAPLAGGDIVLRFRSESWVDIVDRNGVHIERGLIAAGAERRFTAAQLARVTLGDAAAVEVHLAGAELDLTPYREANIARFTVSSDGKIARALGG